MKKYINKINSFFDNYKDDIYDINSIFKNIDKYTLNDLINYYLENINISKNNIDKYIDRSSKFIKCFNINNNLYEEANIISDDLLYKLLDNSYNIIPFNIDNCINYSISHFIDYNDINIVLYLIVIKLSYIQRKSTL